MNREEVKVDRQTGTEPAFQFEPEAVLERPVDNSHQGVGARRHGRWSLPARAQYLARRMRDGARGRARVISNSLSNARNRRTLWRRTRLTWKILSSFVISGAGVATVFYFAFLLALKFDEHAIEIAPISVTKGLSDQGYTPTVVADRLRDAVNNFILRARSIHASEKIALRSDEPDITVPSVGLSIDTIVDSISSHFNTDNVQSVWGEVVQRNGQLWMTLRMNHFGVIGVYSASYSNPDSLFTSAGRGILKRTEPYIIGFILLDEGKRDEAIAQFREAVRLDPRAGFKHIILGDALSNDGKRDEAIEQYREAIQLDPRSADAHVDLGNVFNEKGNLDEAIAEYREAIWLDPHSAGSHNNLGNVLFEQGKGDEAIAEYREAMRLDPHAALQHNNLGNVLFIKLGKREEAIAEYREAIRLDPRALDSRIALGNVLSALGKRDEAIAEYREVMRLDPHTAHPYIELGTVLNEEGKRDEAIGEYCEAIRLDPRAAGPHIGLGNVLSVEGKHGEAIAEYREALRLDPKLSALPNVALGNILNEKGKRDEAIGEYREAMRLDRNVPLPDDGLRIATADASCRR